VAARCGLCAAVVAVPLLLLATPARVATPAGHRPPPASGVATPSASTRAARPPGGRPATAVRSSLAAPASPGAAAAGRAPGAAAGTTLPLVNAADRRRADPIATPVPGAPAATGRSTDSPPPPVIEPVRSVGRPPPSPAPPPAHAVTGAATWYRAAPGTCASPTLAFGTEITVTALGSGTSVRCTVDDRQVPTPGRVLDLAEPTFSELTRLSVGVLEVHLSW